MNKAQRKRKVKNLNKRILRFLNLDELGPKELIAIERAIEEIESVKK